MTDPFHLILPSSSTIALPSPTYSEDSQPTASARPVEDNLHHHTHPPSTPSPQCWTLASEVYAELPFAYPSHPSNQVTTNYPNYQIALQTNPLTWDFGQMDVLLGKSVHSSSTTLGLLATPPSYNIHASLMNMIHVFSSSQGAPPQEVGYHYTAASGFGSGPGLDSVVEWGDSSTPAALGLPVPGDADHNVHISMNRGVNVVAEVARRHPYLPISPVLSRIPSDASGRSHLQFSGSSSSCETTEIFPKGETMGYSSMLPSPISDNNPSPSATASPPSDCTRRPRLAKDGVIRASESRRKYKAEYQCPCGQSFTTRNGLSNHDKAHRGIKEFKCQHCSKDFVTKHDCKRHQKSCCKSSRVPITQA
ncbi:hypothetical protein Moror_8236 [Moniliophthora roreri MCA 2997]|uniref:C2H2-type domain-containing protein n=1 Tax=Moniliophthora roreri (strain MCA 2997) TaxID=1381753 RepID=V2XN33_MONRO|nr:hypothetical protein Moror_8236 [Moniliophthora roreri MCA 2997]